ncbi:MAG TPA: TetR/AcrR family transcriptional regulator [Candidatus Anaerobutyricum faecale]|uniref:TetR family transcriptional regulator n=1 Tax=Eubacterium sp. An11 TaxID=1965542 RepID=UPI000B387A5A|nr:TetR/AcrR family transcriptional regulator C-terminal domain-containing protein [Eubacterium sp. An11]OUQ69282.1 hypothetical protein B5E53_04060 [Eubacterium sp. An11]HJC32626.1 TetR/AcrR family transcriptional regulator [Candidatus Anaerobutyricum faecale]
MTHAENSFQTKTKLAESLKKLMTQKPFSKITISEIIRESGVNRKTFYYHFGDMTGLLRWMFEQSAVNVVKQYKLPQEYKKALSFVMDYIEKNSFILNSIYDSVGLEEMKLFLYPDIQKIIRTCIDSKEKELHLHVKEEFKSFICNLYTEGFTGTLLRQIKSPEKLSREEAISYYSLILNVSLPTILKSAPGQKHTQPET